MKNDNDKVKLALTPLFLCLENGDSLDDDLCKTIVKSVMLLISSERFRCFDIVLKLSEDYDDSSLMINAFLDVASKIQSGEELQ